MKTSGTVTNYSPLSDQQVIIRTQKKTRQQKVTTQNYVLAVNELQSL